MLWLQIMFGIPFGSEIDMWSVGCILAELYLGKPLFYGSDDCSILKKVWIPLICYSFGGSKLILS